MWDKRKARWAVITVIACTLGPPMIGPSVPALADAKLPPKARGTNAAGTGIYLDDSFEATDALARLQPLVQQHKWHDAATLIQRISDQYGDKLIRRAPGYYVGLRGYINRTIAGWPLHGLNAYRTLFERVASTVLDRAAAASDDDDSASLAAVERYYCTVAAFHGAERIAQRAIERGDFPLAEHIYRRLLDEHPDTRSDPQHSRAMLAVVRAMGGATVAGDASGSSRHEKEGARKGEDASGSRVKAERSSGLAADPDTRIRWMGQDRPLREVLDELPTEFASRHVAPSFSEWPILGGNPERNRVAQCAVDELGVQWRFSSQVGFDSQEGADKTDATDTEDDQALDLSAHPVVSDSLVFVQRDRAIQALRSATGELVWQFGPEGEPGSGTSFVLQDRPPGWNAVTVAEGRVYAALPAQGAAYYGYGSSQSPNELVCLDASSGRLRWRVMAAAGDLADVEFDSSPIVDHTRLYVVGRRRRSFGFEDCYLYRIDARTGRVLSRTHVGSASTGRLGRHTSTTSVVALHGDTVYLCSNLGSIAAVSAYTGAVRWVRTYGRADSDTGGEAPGTSSNVTQWHYNAMIWSDQGLVVLPSDGNVIFVLEPVDGQVRQEIPLFVLDGAHDLLGVHGGRMCAAGRSVACYDLASTRIAWSSPIADDAQRLGRGVWANDRLYVPISSGLSVFSVADGARTDLAWDPDGEVGNLLALPDQLIVVGTRFVSAYVRKSAIWNALRTRISADPTNPVPALELAEVAMRGGETSDALDALALAVTRATGKTEPPHGEVRRRLFRDAMGFARTLAERGALNKTVLNQLYDVASAFPTDTTDHLDVRLRFAPLFRAVDRPGRAVALYQQVLKDRSLLELPVDHASGSNVRADVFCEARINELIQDRGSAVYAPFEREAETLLNAAIATDDEDALARVVDAYPNSRAAPRALIARGTLLARRGQSAEAVRFLIQAYHRYEQSVDEPALLKQIADTLEQGGRREDAFRWLTKAALEHPSAVITDGDDRFTFLQYRQRLNDVREFVEPRRARLTPPLDRTFKRSFPAPMSLLAPVFEADPGMRWSRAYVYADGAIHAIDPVTGADVWPDPLPVRESVDLLIARDDLVLFGTSFEVFAVEPTSGHRLWSYGVYPKNLDAPDIDWEDVNAMRGHALRGDRLATLYDDGQLICLNVRDGSEVWARLLSPVPEDGISLGDRVLTYHAVQDGQVLIGLVNAATGDRIDTIATGVHGAVYALWQTIDDQVLLVTSQSVSAYDVHRRTLRWQVPTGDHFRAASLLLNVDALYLSPDGRDLRKMSLEDGRVLWEDVGLVGRGEDDVRVQRVGAQLVVTSSASVMGVDGVTGMVLWRGTTPTDAQFHHRLLTRDYLVAINRPPGEDAENQAYFYDLRNASGAIPPGGTPNLGPLPDLRRILAVDNAILVQTGATTIRGAGAE